MRAGKSCLAAGAVIALLLVAADQFTKFLAVRYLAGSAEITVIPSVFALCFVGNQGAAFGMMRGSFWLFVAIAVVISALAVYVYIRTPAGAHYYPLRAVCILLLAGALGNMTDRLARGYVVDFLYISLIDFPVFNLADCCISVGAVLLILFILTIYRREEFSFLRFHAGREES